MLCCTLSPDANTGRPFSHANGTTFRRTNCQLRLKRSGTPSLLSLHRQWIPSPLKAFLTVFFGRRGDLYLLFSIKTFMIFLCPYMLLRQSAIIHDFIYKPRCCFTFADTMQISSGCDS